MTKLSINTRKRKHIVRYSVHLLRFNKKKKKKDANAHVYVDVKSAMLNFIELPTKSSARIYFGIERLPTRRLKNKYDKVVQIGGRIYTCEIKATRLNDS